MYKFLVFDIDGTLIDTEDAILSALQKMLLVEKDRDISKEELAFVLGIPGHIALQELDALDIENAGDKWNACLKEFESGIRIFPEIESTLKALKSLGLKTGIVTSKTLQEYNSDFVPFGLHSLFEYVVCADDTQKHKPHPEPLLRAIELANASSSDTIYIGDTIYDKECAQAAGVDFGLAVWGARNKEILATYKLNKPSDIFEILELANKYN